MNDCKTKDTLSVQDLDLSYGSTQVVHGAGLVLSPGQIVALVGPNGSGKSTLLRAMARLHGVSAGSIELTEPGTDALDALAMKRNEFAQRVTLLSQSRPVPHGLSVREVVEFGRHPYRGRFRTADPHGQAVIHRAMDMTGVANLVLRVAADDRG